MEAPFYIFDAGGSKTDLVFFSALHSTYHTTLAGYNPNRESTDFFDDLEALDIPYDATVFFYGSGLKSAGHQTALKAHFNVKSIHLFPDNLAAIRATQQPEGIVAILGTGAIVTYFKNDAIIETRGGYGYLIDDFGGGLELGKLIISHWLNGDLSENTNHRIADFLGQNNATFIEHFYKTKNNHTIAQVSKILTELALEDAILNQIIHQYFDTFIKRHVLPLSEKYRISTLSMTGSIAWHFKSYLSRSALKHGIKIDLVIKRPINNLLEYHLD